MEGTPVGRRAGKLLFAHSRACTQLVTTHCGQYGAPTESSLRARALKLEMADGAASPWLCHTFSSKAMGFAVESMEQGHIHADDEVLFWCTKTLVQPGDSDDVFERTDVPPAAVAYMRECGLTDAKQFYDQPQSRRIYK